jgi:hypothetical protein
VAKSIVYHTTAPGGPGLQDFPSWTKQGAIRAAAAAGLAHLFQRRRPDGGLDYIHVPATPRSLRFIKEIARHA